MHIRVLAINDLHGAVLPRVNELRATDGVHYALEGQKFLAQIVAENITKALASATRPFVIDPSGIASTVIVCQVDTPLIQLMAERLADYKVPDFIDFVDSHLPRNAAGKILKNELRDRASGRHPDRRSSSR